MIVAHNLAAMNVQRQFGINTKNRAKSTEKLSSGYRINRAADDAAGLAISEKMRRLIRGLDQGAENTQDGISFVQIGDGAMEEIHDMLHRLTELSVKAANETLTESDRSYINEEVRALKAEINRVADTTEFNEIPIFDNHTVNFGLEGTPRDLEIFNSSYSDTGEVEYGGFVFHGERITWDMINADMVAADGTFVGGEYTYKSDKTNYAFSIICEDGEKPPIITREVKISANENGVMLDDELFEWSKIYDTDGNACSADNLHEGPWAIDYYGSKFMFTVPGPVVNFEEMAKDISSCKNATVAYNWEVYYQEGNTEQAVDMDPITIELENGFITQANVDAMAKDWRLLVTVGADKDGVFLKNTGGAELSGSRMSWADLGIESWEEGMRVPGYYDGKNVTYKYDDPGAGTGLSFEFELSDITSLDSVIDGLDNMTISLQPFRTTYNAAVTDKGGSSAIKSVNCTVDDIQLTFEEEVSASRKFDDVNWSMTADSMTYDDATGEVQVTFLSTTPDQDPGNYTLTANVNEAGGANADIMNSVTSYLEWVEQEKKAGRSGDITDYPSVDTPTGEVLGVIGLELQNEYHDLTDHLNIEYNYDFTEFFKDLGNCVEVQGGVTTYKDKDGNVVSSLEEVVASVAAEVIPEVWSDITGNTQVDLTSTYYSQLFVKQGEENPNEASRPMYHAVMKETPIEPDIYIVHSATPGDRTGIPRFAMNTVALGIAFSSCDTVEAAERMMTATKKASLYVSEKRATYGVLQNRMEHTYNSNRNVSENTAAAESQIRDADMAKEMVKYSNFNILHQVGQSMLAQANQSNQGVLGLLQ